MIGEGFLKKWIFKLAPEVARKLVGRRPAERVFGADMRRQRAWSRVRRNHFSVARASVGGRGVLESSPGARLGAVVPGSGVTGPAIPWAGLIF